MPQIEFVSYVPRVILLLQISNLASRPFPIVPVFPMLPLVFHFAIAVLVIPDILSNIEMLQILPKER